MSKPNDKLRIRLEQNQFVELVATFRMTLQYVDHETLGQLILYNHVLDRMVKRLNTCKPLNGLTFRPFTFYVYDWEICLLCIEKYTQQSGIKLDTYNCITINTIVEALHLNFQEQIN